jgi:glycosyltransferase involved in cell wall biosynthesis
LARAVTIDALTGPIRDGLVRSGTDPDRIRVSPGSFVDTDRFRGEAGKEPWVVFTGRLVEEKNPLLFVEACALVQARLKDRLPRLRFYLIGDGPLREQVEARIDKLGLAGSVETGWRDDVERVLAAAAVFVSLQRTDNYPSQALLEAMACECAAVATDVGQTERLVDEAAGHRVAPSPAAVAEAIGRILDDPARAREMGRQGRRRVLEFHSTDAYLDYVEHLYTTVREGFGLEGVSPSNAECVTHHPSPITHHSLRS